MLSHQNRLISFINEGLSAGTINLCELTRVSSISSKDFKSHAERRFARSCDSRGIQYKYEPFTFIRVLRNIDGSFFHYGVGEHQYTPDFYIPSLDLYVEVKAQDSSLTKTLFQKYHQFGTQMMRNNKSKFAVINYGYSNERTNKLEMSNFGHPDVEDQDLNLLSLLMEF